MRFPSLGVLALLLTAACDRTGHNPAVAEQAVAAPLAPPVALPPISPAPADVPWYAQTLVRDLTGDGIADTTVLIARGPRPDSSGVVLTIHVDGRPAFEERWDTPYELIDPPDSVRTAADRERFLRARFARVLSELSLSPLDTGSLSVMEEDAAERAALDSITPRPTHQVMLAYGYETVIALFWDPVRRRFVSHFICC